MVGGGEDVTVAVMQGGEAKVPMVRGGRKRARLSASAHESECNVQGVVRAPKWAAFYLLSTCARILIAVDATVAALAERASEREVSRSSKCPPDWAA